MLKEGTHAVVERDSYPVLPIFKLLAKKGNIEEKMMYNTFNMGLGMILAVAPAGCRQDDGSNPQRQEILLM